MRPELEFDASCADHGEAAFRFVGFHSRSGCFRPALFPRPRPAEWASGTTHLALQLAYDSLREPAPAGLRGGLHGDRHLVYMSREYAVDVHFEPRDRRGPILRGELLSRSDGPLAAVPAFLLEGDQIAGYDCTGSLGEFRLEAANEADLRLCLLLDAERCIDLPIDADCPREAA